VREARGLDRDRGRRVDGEDVEVRQSNLTAGVQLRPIESRHWPLGMSNFVMRPTSGPVTFSTLTFGAGSPPGNAPQGGADAPPSQTGPSPTVVVWLPDLKTAA
jgi:hypothetical protein